LGVGRRFGGNELDGETVGVVEEEAALTIGSNADRFVGHTHLVELANSGIHIVDRESQMAEATRLRVRRTSGRIGESEEFDEIIAVEREFSHHGTSFSSILLADNTASQDSAIEAQGCLIIRTNNGDVIDSSELKHKR